MTTRADGSSKSIGPLVCCAFGALLWALGCAGESARVDPASEGPPTLVYAGSSTVANFMQEAEPVYGKARFVLRTEPESFGGERMIQTGEVDLAGMACEPSEETLLLGIHATFLASDALAVVVNVENPIANLTLGELKRIFTGKVRNWKELGGNDVEIVPLVVMPDSATHTVFRSIVLGAEHYHGCRVIIPDSAMNMNVEAEPGAIGAISHSFLCLGGSVRVVNVGGEPPLPSNLKYPIRRPLYLLWRPGDQAIHDFIAWTTTRAAQVVIEKCFGSGNVW
jgi:phosphate transport system substrate-binding protein